MISHKHKLIFIHIPKCAGSSIRDHFFEGMRFNWKKPDYENLYGWCHERRIHLQHATAKQLLETGLISEDIWKAYFKFTFVRNPWDRAYSDYLWVMEDRKIKGSFREYMNATGPFKEIFTNQESKNYRGDHKIPQTEFFDLEGAYKMDFVGRFETLEHDMQTLNERLKIPFTFNQHSKKNKRRKPHYSLFYGKTERKLVQEYYANDIQVLKYYFENKKSGIQRIKDLF